MYEPGLDAIVIDYQTPDDLANFLRSYSPEIPSTLHIGLVEPTTWDHRAAERAPDAKVASWETNVGYARAVNMLASVGDREVIGIFNADVVLTPGSTEELSQALIRNDRWGILGPAQLDDRRRFVHGGIMGTPAAPHMRGWLATDHGQYAEVEEAVMVSGSAVFIKREVWDQLTSCPIFREVAPDAAGAFLPTQHYYEETWCCYHARAHGWLVMYYGPVRITHRWHKASPIGGFADKQMPASREYFRAACRAHGLECD